ncbi:hypothetical protein XAR_0923 [Xanthomonas citri pv. glycines str. 8ra]|nr:hypothetical protein XAR_0923 [Xanthomonas citri pv. glycines str. 8ra]
MVDSGEHHAALQRSASGDAITLDVFDHAQRVGALAIERAASSASLARDAPFGLGLRVGRAAVARRRADVCKAVRR